MHSTEKGCRNERCEESGRRVRLQTRARSEPTACVDGGVGLMAESLGYRLPNFQFGACKIGFPVSQ